MATDKRVRLDLMCSPSVKSTLRALADAEGLSMSQYVERLILGKSPSPETVEPLELADIRHQLDSITAFLVAEHDYMPF